VRQRWQKKGEEALAVAERMATDSGLPIKLVAAEYTFDGQQLTLLYVSDAGKARVDTIVHGLQRKLGVHVELRRVGPRDHARMLGGYGACGEPRCCSRFLTEFKPISIKMAKTQGVSLNPSEITGICGRLRCCLVYEHAEYEAACKTMPRRKRRVRTPYGEGKVVDLLPLQGMVVVQIDDRRLDVPAEDVELVS
jgi:cell fate regulator YaaT (PSP1 superfamily)